MNGVFYPCCNRWHPTPASHRTGPRGECVVALLSKPLEQRPAASPVPGMRLWPIAK